MRIALFTDIHIGEENELLHSVDVRSNFVKIMDAISREETDLVVLGGDLCATLPSEGIYNWIRQILISFSLENDIHIIPGNHDDTLMLHKIFNIVNTLNNNELYYNISSDCADLIFLDTSIGSCSSRQKSWLEKQIRKSQKNLIIFMHHPPFLCDVLYMDQHHALQDRADFQAIFSRFPNRKINIFCGHYHVEKTLIFDNVNLFITPSCFVQIDQEDSFFKPDHYLIGYRLIDITPEGHIRTTVKYIDN